MEIKLKDKLLAHLQLMRPANIVTAIADILAGFAASGIAFSWTFIGENGLAHHEITALSWLIISTIGLYGGGIVFNDVFDAKLDKEERPERPIPSGRASKTSGGILGGILLVIGIVAAAQVSSMSVIIASAVALLALLYDGYGKHQSLWGPINMGLCRGGNLLLGVSAVPAMVYEVWYLSLIPIIYIAAITMISRGEVHGANRQALIGGMLMYSIVVIAIILLSSYQPIPVLWVMPFVLLFIYLIFPPLLRALNNREPKFVGKAVKAGVLSLIVMDAALGAAYAGWQFGLAILILLPISIFLAKIFAVT